MSVLCLEDVNLNSPPSKANRNIANCCDKIYYTKGKCDTTGYFISWILSVYHARLSKLKSFFHHYHSKTNEINEIIQFGENSIHYFSLFLIDERGAAVYFHTCLFKIWNKGKTML